LVLLRFKSSSEKYAIKGDLLFAWSTTLSLYLDGEKSFFSLPYMEVLPMKFLDKTFAFYYCKNYERHKSSSHGQYVARYKGL
jgi:hypothetical protein